MRFSTANSLRLLLLAFAAMPTALFAQSDKQEEKQGSEQILILRDKSKTNSKLTIVVDGDKVTVNGKDAKEGQTDGVTVFHNKSMETYTWPSYNGTFQDMYVSGTANRAMLGVTTEKSEKGAKIKSITKESGAEKASLKPGDIITRVDDKKIETPDALSLAIRDRKPGDKVTVAYLRDNKEQKVTVELSKWRGVSSSSFNTNNLNLDNNVRIRGNAALSDGSRSYSLSTISSTPKLGLSVQDTDDGKGVKVLSVDKETNAEKAGIKENDVITEVDGKPVNGTDDITKIIRDSKTKISVPMKIERNGRSQVIEVRMPRKVKTADL